MAKKRSDQRHFDCGDCRFHRPRPPSGICLRCDAGEFFEERIYDREPSEEELFKFISETSEDDDD